MRQQTELLSGVTAYQQHDYLAALKHFGSAKHPSHSQNYQTVIETLIGVTNLQLCNYNDAAKTLHRLREKLQHIQLKDLLTNELAVVKCKVISNLLILELLNCNQTANQYLRELQQIVFLTANKNRPMGIGLFKVIVKSLFGFQTFADINDQLRLFTDKDYQITQNINSPIYLTALSIYAHLSGQHKQAYHLQLNSYQLSKDKQPLLAALSLRHLQELCLLLKNEKGRKGYQRQLKRLMSGELQGVAEQTLFRNYDKKLQLASSIVAELIKQQRDLVRVNTQQGVQGLAVVWKLETMQKTQTNNRIAQVLELIRQSKDVMAVMGENEFVKDAVKEYKAAINRMAATIQKVAKRIAFDQLGTTFKSMAEMHELMQFKRKNGLSSQEQLQEIQGSRTNRSFDSSTSARKRHQERATSFYLAKQAKHSNDGRSQLMVNKPKKYDTNPIHKDNKANAIYKISKQNPHKEHKPNQNQQQSELEVDNREAYSVNNNKPYTKPIAKEERKEPNKSSKFKEIDRLQPYAKQPEINIQLLQEISSSKPNQSSLNQPKPRELIKTNSNMVQQSKLQPESKLLTQTKSITENKPVAETKLATERNKQSKPFASNVASQKFSPLIQREFSPQNTKAKRAEQPAFTSMTARQNAQKKLPKMISQCQSGQFIQKRHFTSDGGAERFLQLSKHKDKIAWADSEDSIDFNNHSSSYSMNDIRGIVYGKVTETMRKQCNAKLDPTKCFSLILKKRTLDLYCPKEVDIFFWLPGISTCLKDFIFQNQKYAVMKKSRGKIQKKVCNKLYLQNKEFTRYYSLGRLLWKRFLMRIKNEYLSQKKKEKKHRYHNPNAFAIVAAAVKRTNFKTTLTELR